MDITKLHNRDDFGAFLTANGFCGQGVEIGALSGGNARQIVSTWQAGILYLVDLWKPQPAHVYREEQKMDFGGCFDDCKRLADEFHGRIVLMQADSLDAAKAFEDGTLDFVYLDGNHCFEAVTADIWKWHPKVRPGGIFGGHDLWDDTNYPSFGEVKSAVEHWSKRRNIPFHYTPKCGSWWTVKT